LSKLGIRNFASLDSEETNDALELG